MSRLNIYKQKILIASRALYANNGIANVQAGFSGHVSGRLPGEDKYLITWHTHEEGRSTLGDIGFDDLITIEIDKGIAVTERSILHECIIHTSIYKARKDVNSVVHTHPFWCTVWSLVEKPILKIPVLVSDRFMIETEKDGEDLAKTLDKGKVVLIAGHGLVTVGETIEQASTLTASIEELAQKLYYASLQGRVPETYVDQLLGGSDLIQFSSDPTGGDLWLWFEEQLKKRKKYPILP